MSKTELQVVEGGEQSLDQKPAEQSLEFTEECLRCA